MSTNTLLMSTDMFTKFAPV